MSRLSSEADACKGVRDLFLGVRDAPGPEPLRPCDPAEDMDSCCAERPVRELVRELVMLM